MQLKKIPIFLPPFFLSIILCLSHCLLLSISFYLITMKEMFLFVWNAKTFTCVPDSITSHFLNEPRILLKYLGVNLSKNTPHLIHISSHLLPYFFIHITLKLWNISTSAVLTSSLTPHSQCMIPVHTVIQKLLLRHKNDHYIPASNKTFFLLICLELKAAHNRLEYFPYLKHIFMFSLFPGYLLLFCSNASVLPSSIFLFHILSS